MELIKSFPFKFEDKEYETRIFSRETNEEPEYVVRVFINNSPANGYSYNVTRSINSDLLALFEESGVEYLIKRAQEDVENKIWEKFINLK